MSWHEQADKAQEASARELAIKAKVAMDLGLKFDIVHDCLIVEGTVEQMIDFYHALGEDVPWEMIRARD